MIKVCQAAIACIIFRLTDNCAFEKIRGFQVAPAELEGCLLDHSFVRDACVVGSPHTISGEVPFAFITLTEEGMQLSQVSVKQALRQVSVLSFEGNFFLH